MKKFIKKLLGDILVKEILLTVGNKLITVFVMWLVGKLHDKFSGRQWFHELRNYLFDIQLQDFFNDRKKDIEAITLKDETTL